MTILYICIDCILQQYILHQIINLIMYSDLIENAVVTNQDEPPEQKISQQIQYYLNQLRQRKNKIYDKENLDQFYDQMNKSQRFTLAPIQNRFLLIYNYTFFEKPMQIQVLNLTSVTLHFDQINHGSFGVVLRYNPDTVIKRIQIKPDRQYSDEVDDLLNQYYFYKICQRYNIGPQVKKISTFDMIFYKNGIQFFIELCVNKEQWLKNVQTDKFKSELQSCLMQLHCLNIVHKDIKPGNILYSLRLNKFILSDFGLTCFTKTSVDQKDQSYRQGTPGYMHPDLENAPSQTKIKINLYQNDCYALYKTIKDIREMNLIKQNQKQSNLQYLKKKAQNKQQLIGMNSDYKAYFQKFLNLIIDQYNIKFTVQQISDRLLKIKQQYKNFQTKQLDTVFKSKPNDKDEKIKIIEQMRKFVEEVSNQIELAIKNKVIDQQQIIKESRLSKLRQTKYSLTEQDCAENQIKSLMKIVIKKKTRSEYTRSTAIQFVELKDTERVIAQKKKSIEFGSILLKIFSKPYIYTNKQFALKIKQLVQQCQLYIKESSSQQVITRIRNILNLLYTKLSSTQKIQILTEFESNTYDPSAKQYIYDNTVMRYLRQTSFTDIKLFLDYYLQIQLLIEKGYSNHLKHIKQQQSIKIRSSYKKDSNLLLLLKNMIIELTLIRMHSKRQPQEYQLMKKYLNDTLALFETQQSYLFTKIYLNVGNFYCFYGEYRKALAYYGKKQLWAQNRCVYIEIINKIKSCLMKVNDPIQTEEKYRNILAISQNIFGTENPFTLQNYYEFATIKYHNKQYQQALPLFQKSLNGFDRKIRCIYAIPNTHFQKKQFSKALCTYKNVFQQQVQHLLDQNKQVLRRVLYSYRKLYKYNVKIPKIIKVYFLCKYSKRWNKISIESIKISDALKYTYQIIKQKNNRKFNSFYNENLIKMISNDFKLKLGLDNINKQKTKIQTFLIDFHNKSNMQKELKKLRLFKSNLRSKIYLKKFKSLN